MIHNPFWDEVQTFPRNKISWKYDNRWEPDWCSVPIEKLRSTPEEKIRTRNHLCVEYAWSIPDPDSLSFVAKHLGSHAIEGGAGTGYYASMLAQLGTHVICYDICPPHRKRDNPWCSPRCLSLDYPGSRLSGELRPVYQEIYYGGPGKAACYTYPLFLSWPPMSSMAYKTLKAYAGNKLVYIGESDGGCTADGQFFDLLDKQWELIDQHQPIQWFGIHDYISVYERKNR